LSEFITRHVNCWNLARGGLGIYCLGMFTWFGFGGSSADRCCL